MTVSHDEWIKIISNSKLRKTTINRIHVETFIYIKNYVVHPLCKIINLSFGTGTEQLHIREGGGAYSQ